ALTNAGITQNKLEKKTEVSQRRSCRARQRKYVKSSVIRIDECEGLNSTVYAPKMDRRVPLRLDRGCSKEPLRVQFRYVAVCGAGVPAWKCRKAQPARWGRRPE